MKQRIQEIGPEEEMWQKLAQSTPADVCQRSGADFLEKSGTYVLKVFNVRMEIDPKQQEMRGMGQVSHFLLKAPDPYLRLSLLCYLLSAKDLPLANRLINPRELSGGLIFTQGSHILPLNEMAERYGDNLDLFLTKGEALGAEKCYYGDASIRLFPFPRVPVVLVLWENSKEFPAGMELLLDASCQYQLPLDIIWSVAMVSTGIMLS